MSDELRVYITVWLLVVGLAVWTFIPVVNYSSPLPIIDQGVINTSNYTIVGMVTHG